MAPLYSILPPISRHAWELVVSGWRFFPLFTTIQWFTDFFPMGKRSIRSRFNLPGPLGWAIMESPGFFILLYHLYAMPYQRRLSNSLISPTTLPPQNYLLAAIYLTHYTYRAFLFPILNPSMSPINIIVVASAFVWHVANGLSLAGWITGYGPTESSYWQTRGSGWVLAGTLLWMLGFAGNVWHDGRLREMRREVKLIQEQASNHSPAKGNTVQSKTQDKKDMLIEQTPLDPQFRHYSTKTITAASPPPQHIDRFGNVFTSSSGTGIDKIYLLPSGGLFEYVLHAHHFCEWIEWFGYWMIGGFAEFVPGRSFWVNLVAAMLPQALFGWRWYVEKFGREKVGKRMAVIPFLI